MAWHELNLLRSFRRKNFQKTLEKVEKATKVMRNNTLTAIRDKNVKMELLLLVIHFRF